ncbi:MAG: sulfotransferase [Pseudomonadota bacterium]|nr:sulfotransferase [Pseudomonadota bacterium]
MTGNHKPPFFIVGPPRSGTTLMGRILARHTDIESPGESHFFEDVWSRREEIGSLEKDASLDKAVKRTLSLFGRYNFPETQAIVSRTIDAARLKARVKAGGAGYPVLYSEFMTMLAEQSGKRWFCDDTPKHLFYLDDILELYPETRVLCMIRDPRDYLASYKNYWRRSTESDRVRKLYHPILTTMLWQGSAGLVLKYAEHPRVKLVHYENLVRHPAEEIRSICGFLGIEYTPGLLEVESDNSSYGGHRRGIDSCSVGRWRANLHDAEVWWHQRLATTRMSALGYEQARVRPSLLSTSKILFTAPGAIVNALNANAGKRGPLLNYVARRLLAMLPSWSSRKRGRRPGQVRVRDEA